MESGDGTKDLRDGCRYGDGVAAIAAATAHDDRSEVAILRFQHIENQRELTACSFGTMLAH